MSDNFKSLRSPLAKARGLGSARSGTHHWFMQRVTALALVVLSLFLVGSFFHNVVFGDAEASLSWLGEPVSAIALIIFLCVAFHHAASGLQVVIEDYVHSETFKLASIIAVRFFCYTFATIGVIAIVKIIFFAIFAYMMQNEAPHG